MTPAEAAAQLALRLLASGEKTDGKLIGGNPAGIEMAGAEKNLDRALAASGDELTALLHHADAEVLLALLDNPCARGDAALHVAGTQKPARRKFSKRLHGGSRC